MADLHIVSAWTCSSNIYWHKRVQGSGGPASVYDVRFENRPLGPVQHDYTCTCAAFAFGKGQYCKHIKQVMSERCGWNAEMDPGASPEPNHENEPCCPDCSEEVQAFNVGV